jgi:WD40 repeat protein
MKWLCRDSSVLLGIALASGYVDLYAVNRAASVQNSLQSLNLPLDKLTSCFVTDGLCLSIDSWNTESDVQLVVSNSPGTISILKCVESEVKDLVTWKAHDFEPWIVAWDKWNQNVVLTGKHSAVQYIVLSWSFRQKKSLLSTVTWAHNAIIISMKYPSTVVQFMFEQTCGGCGYLLGGDDCKLKFWDTRSLSRPQHTCKHHSMGVCSVASHPSQPHVFASGSYDEMVCVWDTRHMMQPLCEVGVGGGVWRLKWHPVDKGLLLAACMHNGCHVLQWETGLLSVVVGYYQHKSLLYGIDWGRMRRYESVVASCSFYDQAFHLWCYKERVDEEG